MKSFALSALTLVMALAFVSCSQVRTINLQRHHFSTHPKQVVWIQVAGLRPEHLSMLRFNRFDSHQPLSLESATCIGHVWNYNIYNLRPKAHESFLAQIHGTKNITNTCDDFASEPFWELLGTEEYRVGIFETSGQFSYEEKIRECRTQELEDSFGVDAYDNAIFWKMTRRTQSENQNSLPTFHYQSSDSFESGQVYYDQTCQGPRCFAGVSQNLASLWSRFSPDYQRKILIVQDYTYLEALKNQDIQKAREILSEIEKAYQYFSDIQKTRSDFLLVLSSAESMGLEMPSQGQQWEDFEKSGSNIIYQRSSLDSVVYAQGAMAENLCGIYEEAEIGRRIPWKVQESRFFLFN